LDAAELKVNLHVFTGTDACDRMQRDLRLFVCRVLSLGIGVVVHQQVKKEEALADLIVAAGELLVAVEAESQEAPFLHLCMRQVPHFAALDGDRGQGRCRRWRWCGQRQTLRRRKDPTLVGVQWNGGGRGCRGNLVAKF